MENKYVLRPLFTRFQKELVSYANTQTGRDFISGFGGKELKENYPIVKITPDSVHQQLDKKTFRAVFYPRSPFIGKFAESLTYCDIAEANKYKVEEKLKEFVIPHYLGETNRLKNVLPTIYVDSGTFNPDANPESTSVDGDVRVDTTDKTWTNLRATAGTASYDLASTMTLYLREGTPPNWQNLYRLIFLFDTSSLTSSATITAATLSLYQTGSIANNWNKSLNIVTSSPASSTALASSDFAQLQTVAQSSDVALSSISTSAYNDWALNATGLSNISKTSISKFGMTWDADRTNTDPVANKGAGTADNCNFYTADNASNKPKLVVTYTLPFAGGVIII